MSVIEQGILNQLKERLAQFQCIHGVQPLMPGLPKVEFTEGSHKRPTKLIDEWAVYAFFRHNEWLKIGHSGYPERFRNQHYGTKSSSSTFAKDVWKDRQQFGYEGSEQEVGQWIEANFGRLNIRIPNPHGQRLSKLLEAYLHFHLQPKYEGRRKV